MILTSGLKQYLLAICTHADVFHLIAKEKCVRFPGSAWLQFGMEDTVFVFSFPLDEGFDSWILSNFISEGFAEIIVCSFLFVFGFPRVVG